MEREAFEAMGAVEHEHWWFVGRRRIVSSLIAGALAGKHRPRILEAGCGTGGNLKMLAEFGDLEAFEFDYDARKVAQRVSGLPVAQGRLPDGIDHIQGPFDVIALLDVLEHIEGDVAALRALAAKLKPGGFLVLTVPAFQFLWSEHDEFHHHHRRYSRRQLERVLREGDFIAEKISYFNSLLFPLALVQRMGSRLLGRQLGDPNASPAKPVNRLFADIFGFERVLLKHANLPVGLSLCAVCRRADG